MNRIKNKLKSKYINNLLSLSIAMASFLGTTPKLLQVVISEFDLEILISRSTNPIALQSKSSTSSVYLHESHGLHRPVLSGELEGYFLVVEE